MPKSLIKSLGIAAGCLGLVQAIGYTVMVILCILSYENVLEPINNEKFLTPIYIIFLQKNPFFPSILKVDGTKFFIFMCVYLPLYIIWTISSGWLLKNSMDSKITKLKNLALVWAFATIAVCILDFILTGLLAHDLSYIRVNTDTAVAYIIVMSVVAKGYVLWITNLILALILVIKLKGLRDPSTADMNRPIIYGYDTQPGTTPYNVGNTSATPWIFSTPKTTPANSYYDASNNRGFDVGNYDSGFETSRSFQPVAPPQTSDSNVANRNFDRNIPQGRLATIGKPGRRSPPSSSPPKLSPISGPFIPEPDYTPPGTPTLKSSLKPRPLY